MVFTSAPFALALAAAVSAEVSAAPPSAAAASWTEAFPWQRVPTMAWTGMWGPFARKNMTGTGRLDDKVLRFLAENNELIVVNGLEPKSFACMESKVKDFADRVASFNPNARVIIYNANNIHHGALLPPAHGSARSEGAGSYMCGLDHFKLDWATTYDNGTRVSFLIPEDLPPLGNNTRNPHYMHNLSIPAVRDWWVDVITNKSLGTNVHGVFADNALAAWGSLGYEDWYLKDSPERGQALLQGQQALFEQVRKAGKYVIFNGLRPTQDYVALDTLLPHADSGYFEPWLGGSFRNAAGKLNASKATQALQKMISHSTTWPEHGVTFRSSPAGDVPSSGGGVVSLHDVDPAVMRANATAKIHFPLASFLCAANARWKFCYAYSYNIQSYARGDPASGNHTVAGQPLLPSWVPDNWYPVLKQSPGTPMHECAYDSATQTFRREWTGVSIELSMANETASIRWK